MCSQRSTSHAHCHWSPSHRHSGRQNLCWRPSRHTLPRGGSPIFGIWHLAFAQTADLTTRELLLRWHPFFWRQHGNSARMRLRRLLGLVEPDQPPEFRGTQHSRIVLNPVTQKLPSHIRSAWTEWHKKDASGQWSVISDLPARPLNVPHVAPDVLHQIYPYVVWWAADLVATQQQKNSLWDPRLTPSCGVLPPNKHPRFWRLLPSSYEMKRSPHKCRN